MTNRLLIPSIAAALLATGVLLWSTQAAAMVIVEAAVSSQDDAFRYDFTVVNEALDDLLVVSTFDAPLDDPLIHASASAPDGFFVSYDPFLGIVDLLADAELFAAGSIVGVFTFLSRTAPDSGVLTRFDALTTQGEVLTGDIALLVRDVAAPSTFLLAALVLAVVATVRTTRSA